MPLLNATAFCSMYLGRAKHGDDMSFFALIEISRGVEEPYQTPEGYRNAVIYVPPAVTRILLGGKGIYGFCKSDRKCIDNQPGYVVDEASCKWQQGRGYSLGRWAFWKERLDVIAMTQ